MRQVGTILAWVLIVGMNMGLILCSGWETVQAAEPIEETTSAPPSRAGTWSGGGAIGFLANTPDDTAFAFNLNADRFFTREFSLGPLLQLAFTGDMNQVGFSGQAKYWLDLPGMDNRAKLVLQGGIGFIYSDFLRDDISWLIPIGVGLDYAVNQNIKLTTNFLLNFTDLDTGFGTGANVMPGLTFGVRF